MAMVRSVGTVAIVSFEIAVFRAWPRLQRGRHDVGRIGKNR